MKQFGVWCPDLGEGREHAWRTRADDHYNAAEKWAKDYDCTSAEYTIVGGEEVHLLVAEEESDEVMAMTVVGEAVPIYTARQRER